MRTPFPRARLGTTSWRSDSPANNPPRRIKPIDPINLNMYAGLSVGSSGFPCLASIMADIASVCLSGEPHAMRSAQNNGYSLVAKEDR